MIGHINSAAFIWSKWMGGMFWQVGLLIILIMIIDMAIRRRAWPHVRYVLWGMVFLKLLIPPTWHMPTGIVSSIQPTVSEHFPVQIEPNFLFDAATPSSVITEPGQNQDSEPAAAEKATWQTALFLIWIGGMLFFALMLAVQLSRLPKRSQRRHARNAPEWFEAVLNSTSSRLRLKKTPTVIFSGKAKSPAVYGLFRPVLVLPRGYFDNLTRDQAEHVLLHELCHVKRGDLWVHWFCIMLQIVYWFNPLLILARRQMRHISEICCDLSVAYVLREKTAAYRETLLSTSRKLLADAAEPGIGLLGIFEEPFRIVARLKWLDKKTWEHRKRKIAATIVAILIMVGFVMPMAGHSQPPETNEVRSGKMGNPDGVSEFPETEEDLRAIITPQLENTYAPLFEDLELPQEKVEAFKELLVDETIAQIDILLEIQGDTPEGTPVTHGELTQRIADVVKEYDREITEVIGEDAYSEFAAYRDTLFERQLLIAFNNNQPEKEMLVTAEQVEKLVPVMYEARIKTVGKDSLVQDMSFEDAGPVIAAYLDSAKPILSESQLENLHRFLLSFDDQDTPETFQQRL